MNIKITETQDFSKLVNWLIKKRTLLEADFKDFKRGLSNNPELGDIIPGTHGVRKIRLKSASKGKRGGFRVCYYYILNREIYLLFIYPKNVQLDITMEDKKMFRELVVMLKEALNE